MNTTPDTNRYMVEEQLQDLAGLCQRAGESTAWLVPKIETIIMTLAHARAAEDERADVLAFLKAEDEKRRRATHDFICSDNVDAAERCEVRASLLRSLIAMFTRGDHEGAASR